jgi:tRNA A37 methylthiotransferase MiaB
MSKNIFIYSNWTCVRRKLDAGKFARYFTENNHQIIYNPKEADVIILVTCAFTNHRTEQAINLINHFKKYNKEFIIAGCLPDIEPDIIKKIYDVKIISTKEIERIDELFPEHSIKFDDIDEMNNPWANIDLTRPYDSLKKFIGRSNLIRNFYTNVKKIIHKSSIYDTAPFTWYANIPKKPFFIQPSSGCLGKCSYCATCKAIGKIRSKPIQACIEEFKKGLNQGHKNFILDADDIGCYGLDINSSFIELIDKITNIDGDYQVDVHYIRPIWIIKYFKQLEQIIPKGKIRRILSSIQSGNPRVLELMYRYSATEKLKDIYLKLKNINNDLILETEAICGFPSETRNEFKDTLNFIREIRFDWGAIFPFSCKSETMAEKIKPQIDKHEITKRMNYARRFLKESGYDVRYAKYLRILSQDILVFCDTESMSNYRKNI